MSWIKEVTHTEKRGVRVKQELEDELKTLKQNKDKISKKLDTVNSQIAIVQAKIQDLCQHDWSHRYTDNHDGYSRVTYTQTETSLCKKCGKIEVTERDYDY